MSEPVTNIELSVPTETTSFKPDSSSHGHSHGPSSKKSGIQGIAITMVGYLFSLIISDYVIINKVYKLAFHEYD